VSAGWPGLNFFLGGGAGKGGWGKGLSFFSFSSASSFFLFLLSFFFFSLPLLFSPPPFLLSSFFFFPFFFCISFFLLSPFRFPPLSFFVADPELHAWARPGALGRVRGGHRPGPSLMDALPLRSLVARHVPAHGSRPSSRPLQSPPVPRRRRAVLAPHGGRRRRAGRSCALPVPPAVRVGDGHLTATAESRRCARSSRLVAGRPRRERCSCSTARSRPSPARGCLRALAQRRDRGGLAGGRRQDALRRDREERVRAPSSRPGGSPSRGPSPTREDGDAIADVGCKSYRTSPTPGGGGFLPSWPAAPADFAGRRPSCEPATRRRALAREQSPPLVNAAR